MRVVGRKVAGKDKLLPQEGTLYWSDLHKESDEVYSLSCGGHIILETELLPATAELCVLAGATVKAFIGELLGRVVHVRINIHAAHIRIANICWTLVIGWSSACWRSPVDAGLHAAHLVEGCEVVGQRVGFFQVSHAHSEIWFNF
jgi:hypothetical protein